MEAGYRPLMDSYSLVNFMFEELVFLGWTLLYGWSILLWAIILNITASYLGITTWYEYSQKISGTGFMKATASLTILEVMFLFLLYPGLLGLAIAVLIFLR